jgi:hypothetical protein
MPDLEGPRNLAASSPCLDVASLDAENQFSRLDSAAFGVL